MHSRLIFIWYIIQKYKDDYTKTWNDSQIQPALSTCIIYNMEYRQARQTITTMTQSKTCLSDRQLRVEMVRWKLYV